ncbi:LOW QUALITY PROTEIN: transcription initiation factor TFIID subunit 5-like [Ruditapes philippinarum]|uniref:LOW QUALITY PROTEIN: transcription initiation factor TFIID subunit 5-like n=1 Tax=Ruditapes philippinarum TaxID=129788 RepID=UPI00295C3609|nr:LOW QUALITY PROTEIN: transcription initiation factor TFIID subunit 5-like [Ruditapes philippinarum]
MASNFNQIASGNNFPAGGEIKSENKTDVSDKQTLLAVLQFLKKNNLKGTEELLKKETGLDDADVKPDTTGQSASEVSHALAAYKSDDDPSLYDDHYTNFKVFIESCLDVHKVEASHYLYPVFVHMYLELVYNGHEEQAVKFFVKFSLDQEEYYVEDLNKLSTVTKAEHMKGSQLMENFKSSKFVLKMSRDSYTHLKRYLQEKQLNLLLNIIQEHLFIDVFDGIPRTKQQIDMTSGGLLGEAAREANKTKIFYGLLKEPDINIPADDEDEGGGDGEDKPKKKKQKKDPLMMKKARNDPNAPASTRIPMPELKDYDKMEKINAYREALKRVKIGPNSPPSICFYTFHNAVQGLTSVEISEDSSLMCTGFGDSNIKIWSLTPNKLRSMKQLESLEIIDKESDDVLERMMDERTSEDTKLLVGHSGPVYSTSFSPDRSYLTSCSEDGTVRLWSLQTWTNLVSYKGHNAPVWDVKFSPHGHYFVSGGNDRVARLWTTDHYQPIRIFGGHFSDVDSVQFHPNGNYVATGSSDRTVRIFDVLNGSCVRTLTGHKGAVHSLCFSPDGKYLASSGLDGNICLWDVSNGNMLAQMRDHTSTVYSLSFSRCGAVLASGGLDNCVKLWDVTKVIKEMDKDMDASIPSSLSVNESPNLLIGSFATKATPVLSIHFTRKNLLLAAGPMKVS